MKIALVVLVCVALGILLLRSAPRPKWPGRALAVAVSVRALPTGPQIIGLVLAVPFQAVRTPAGGRVVGVYFNEGQTVKAGAVLLKLAVSTGTEARTVFASAPVAGDLTRAQLSAGQYVAAGTPYARLTPRGPVRVRVTQAAAARLHPGDSLRVLTGPVGLVGVVTPLTALLPDPGSETVVLVFGRIGWPPGTAATVVLAPLHPHPDSVVAAVN